MIKHFKDAEGGKIFRREPSRRYGNLQKTIQRKLELLHFAETLDDLRNPPGNRLEALKGDRSGQFSIRVNDQFRICFQFKERDAYEVEIADYH